MAAVDTHEDIDEQYARLIRSGTRLELLDPLLVRDMFSRYCLGMCAATFVPCDAAPEKRWQLEMYDPQVRDPDWKALWCQPKTVPTAIIYIPEISNVYTWTVNRYRVFAVSHYNQFMAFHWTDANGSIIAMQIHPRWGRMDVYDGMIWFTEKDGTKNVYRLEFA